MGDFDLGDEENLDELREPRIASRSIQKIGRNAISGASTNLYTVFEDYIIHGMALHEYP